jgi:excinuclease ABC subunit A
MAWRAWCRWMRTARSAGRRDAVLDRFACPVCGYSMQRTRTAPVLLQQPGRRLPELRRPRREAVLRSGARGAHPGAEPAGGAIRGWDRRNAYYFQMLSALAKHYVRHRARPFELPERSGGILHGSGEEDRVHLHHGQRRAASPQASLRGHPAQPRAPLPRDRLGMVREELAKFLSRLRKPCPDCAGTRLNRAARHVFVATSRSAAVTTMSVARALAFFDHLQLPGWRGEIAAKIVKEIQNACASWSTSASTTCRSTAAPTPCRAARRSASASPARSARAWSA